MNNLIPRPWLFLIAIGAMWLGGCASRPKEAAYDPKAPPAPYIRIARPDANITELQIASRRFTAARGRGPVVWLVGASHIGESNYFASLQRQLDAHTLVLYEGVGEHARRTRRSGGTSPAPSRAAAAKSSSTNSPSTEGGLQDTMARSLGLVFQLEAMNYERTNYVNSDLSVRELQALMQPGRTFTGETGRASRAGEDEDSDNSFNQLLSAMDGSSSFGIIMKGLMQFIGTSPKLQGMTKLALIETLGAIKADPANMKGLPADMQQLMHVLIRERNKVVLEDLRAELKRAQPGESIAIFYGAAHLPDLEMRLRQELSLRPTEDRWLPAFSVDAAQAGLSNFELTFLRSMIRSQIAPLTE